MKLTIHLVTWNGSKYIPHLFDSLKKQTFKDFKLIILDNASSDDTVEKVRKELADFPFEREFIINKENKGFAGGHNRLNYELGIMNYECEYVLLLNQDMYLMPDCLEKLVKFMDENLEAAAVSPRLMRWDFKKTGDKRYEIGDSFTEQIDTLGLKVLRNRRVIESNTGDDWKIVSDKMARRPGGQVMEVFGVSGALPMYRRSVIEKVGLFDESFVSYKEDVDLAYRLCSAGFRAYTILDAVAYHDRSAAGVERTGDLAAIENKKKQSEWVKFNSYRNHLMVLIKNEYWQNFLFDFFWIFWYELKKFCYFLLFDRKVLRGLKEIWRLRGELRDKRYEIKNKRKKDWRETRKML